METRTAIIRSTASLLAEHGVAGASTRAICAAAGVTAPTLYHHFGNKERLLAAVVADGFARFLTGKEARRPTDDPVADIAAGWDDHVAFGVSNPALYALMFPSAGRPELAEPAMAGFAVLRDLFIRVDAAGRLRPDFTPELAAGAVWAGAYGVTSLLCSHPDHPGAELLSTTVRDAVLGALTLDPSRKEER